MRFVINFQNIYIEVATNQSFGVFQIQIAQNRIKFLSESRYMFAVTLLSLGGLYRFPTMT